MNKTILIPNKKEKLVSLVESVLNSDKYRNELSILMETFSLTQEDVIQAFLDYNMDIFSHGNEIYSSHAIRIVLHIHNLIENSWHIERQALTNDLINIANPNSIIDLGFGVPSLYTRNVLKQEKFITLCDIYEPTLHFAEQLIKIWNPEWLQTVSFLHTDLADVEKCTGEFDLYIFLNSIEHVKDPTLSLSQYVKNSGPNTFFLIELPIGPITPEHYYEWKTVKEVINWTNHCGLDILNGHHIHVNPKVDLFAEQHNFIYSSYLMLCKKSYSSESSQFFKDKDI